VEESRPGVEERRPGREEGRPGVEESRPGVEESRPGVKVSRSVVGKASLGRRKRGWDGRMLEMPEVRKNEKVGR
jgi:hypothetical protein